MNKPWNPVRDVRMLTEGNFGDFENRGGTLHLTFSRQASGDAALQHFLTDLFAAGVLNGDIAALPHGFWDDLDRDHPVEFADNALVRTGDNPDHIVFEVRVMESV